MVPRKGFRIQSTSYQDATLTLSLLATVGILVLLFHAPFWPLSPWFGPHHTSPHPTTGKCKDVTVSESRFAWTFKHEGHLTFYFPPNWTILVSCTIQSAFYFFSKPFLSWDDWGTCEVSWEGRSYLHMFCLWGCRGSGRGWDSRSPFGRTRASG